VFFFIEGKRIKIAMVVIEWIYGDVYERIFVQLSLKKKGNKNFLLFHFKILTIIQNIKDELLCFILAITITNYDFLRSSN
jgi:hypothetical protein